jgi:asparaginyl-tRNA synthetase
MLRAPDEMFQVTTLDLDRVAKSGKVEYDKDFFGKKTNLTVSGQLEGELGATALGAIYTFGPTFRAENSNTPRHLAEFWMIEPEVAFMDKDELMDLEEDFIKYCVQWALDNCQDDLEFLNKMIDKTLLETLGVCRQGGLSSACPYTEGIEYPRAGCHATAVSSNSLSPAGAWTSASEHERYLVEQHFKRPVIMTDYPSARSRPSI